MEGKEAEHMQSIATMHEEDVLDKTLVEELKKTKSSIVERARGKFPSGDGKPKKKKGVGKSKHVNSDKPNLAEKREALIKQVDERRAKRRKNEVTALKNQEQMLDTINTLATRLDVFMNEVRSHSTPALGTAAPLGDTGLKPQTRITKGDLDNISGVPRKNWKPVSFA